MTDRSREAAQAALEAIQELEYSSTTAVADAKARRAKQLLRAALAEQEVEPVAWRLIETAPENQTMLVHYRTRSGTGRTMRARYYPPETLESDTSGWADEGWYEESEAYEYLMPLDGEPTHWMPLPPAPDAALAEQEAEPVAFQVIRGELCYKSQDDDQSYGMWCPVTPQTDLPFVDGTKFYTTPLATQPPCREWQGLTDEEIELLERQYAGYDIYRAIESALKEKNHG